MDKIQITGLVLWTFLVYHFGYWSGETDRIIEEVQQTAHAYIKGLDH